MFDLYIVGTPIIGLVAFLTLINLKLTFKEPHFEDLPYYVKKSDQNNKNQQNKQQSQEQHLTKCKFTKTLFYLVKNFTILDFIIVRRARNKVPLFSSFGIEIGLIYMFGFSFYFSSIGIGITLFFISTKVLTQYLKQTHKKQKTENDKKITPKTKNERKLQVLLSTLSLLINLALIWQLYRNYNNVLLQQTAYNFGIIFLIDNFALKPALFIFLSIPLSYFSYVDRFIDMENQVVQILHSQRILKSKIKKPQQSKNPQKIFVSTYHTENTFQIQPCVHQDPKQNVLLTFNEPKKMNLQKIAPIKKRTSQFYDGNNSSISLFESQTISKQQNHLSKYTKNFKSAQRNSIGSPQIKQNSQELNNSSFKKNHFIKTQNKDYIDQTKNFNYSNKIIQNLEPQGSPNKVKLKTPKSNKSLKEIKFTTSAKKTLQKNHIETSQQVNPFQKDKQNLIHQRKQKIRDEICSNHSYGSNIHGSGGKGDLLKIYEDKFGQDLGEIDFNSPYRKRNPFQVKDNQIESRTVKSKNNKKYSLDPNKNILSLQNTQNIPDHLIKSFLQSEQQKRRSFHQATDLNLSRKSDIYSKYSNDSRISKSFKRTIRSKDPIVRQNNQNQIPQFIIEDFTY